MIGMGIAEIFLIMILNGGMYYPMGVPPAPEDPLMAQIAPQECLFYTTWSGVAKPDGTSENKTEQLLAEREIQQAFTMLEQKLTAFFKAAAERDGNPAAAMAAEMVPKWGKHLVTHPAAIYLESVEPGAESVAINGAILLGVGDQGMEINAMLEKLQEQMLPGAVKEVEIANATYYQFQLAPTAPSITWGVRNAHLVIGIGDDSIENLFANVSRNKKEGLPEWLAGTRKELAVDRFSTVTYANVGKIMELAIPFAGGPGTRAMIDQLGLGNLTHYAATTGLDEKGFVNRSLIGVEGELSGLMKFADAQPLTAEDLKKIPYDTPLAMNMRFDVGQIFDSYFELVRHFDARAAEEMEEGLAMASRAIDVDIRKELIASLGDTWTLYTAPNDGGLITGWTASISVRDSMTLDRVHNTLIGFARASMGDGDGAQIKRRKFGDYDLYCFTVADAEMPFLPTWCVVKDEVVFGLFPQAVKSHLSRGAQDKSLADRPEVAKLLAQGDGPIVVSYMDTQKFFQLIYPLVQVGLQFAFNQAQREGVDLDISLLPSAGSISKHLAPSVTAVHRTSAGIESSSYSTIPSGNIASSAPVMVALLLPAVQAAREAARRAQSANNLKQIAIAIHNFHDTYRTLPAAFSTDKDGKALLSWRVHLLPYLEQAALYEEFHLDEPWDSEHNIKLLEKMPEIFRSPNGRAPAGKTSYLAIGGEKGCFRAPAKDAKAIGDSGRLAGASFAEITDGLSNTIIGVEASDELAVEWTKPVEFKPDPMNPLKGLPGMFPGGFNTMLGDGSVRFIRDTIDKDMLRKLFEKNDGEVVEIP